MRGPGPHLVDSKGTFWDARYVNEGGHVARDLRADVAAEAGALATYEALLKLTDDEGSKKALHFLATREVAHTHMFMEALNSIDKLTEPLFGDFQPGPSVNVYFNMSNGPDADLRGPWNSEPAFQYVANPLQHEQQQHSGKPGSNEMDMLGNAREDMAPNGTYSTGQGVSQGSNQQGSMGGGSQGSNRGSSSP